MSLNLPSPRNAAIAALMHFVCKLF